MTNRDEIKLKPSYLRKRAKESLRKTEGQLKLILDTVPALIWQKDREGKYLQVNKAFCDTVGLSAETIVGKTDYDLFPAEIADHYVSADLKILNSGVPEFGIEERHQKPSGERGWSRTDKMVHYDNDGHIAGTIGFALDISERKRVEEALREREERFSLAMEATKDGLWDWNLNTDEVYYAPGYVSMLGYASSEVPAHFSSWADRIHPEDKNAALKANMDCIENLRDDFEVEFRMQAKNMEWRWILGRGKAVSRDENGRAVRMVGTHTDISERKRVEEALRASEAKYRDIFENATEGIYRVTPEGSRFLTANPAAARILGYESPEELISTITDLATQIYAYPEDREEALRLLTGQGFLKNFDVRCRHKDGSTVWCSFSARVVRDEQGNILYHEGTSQDITDR
jgi:PAS domain S-box-containing protein